MALSMLRRTACPRSPAAPWRALWPAAPRHRQVRHQQGRRYPTLEEVDHLCRNIREVSNESLAVLALLECPPATRERLVREVMAVDRVEWEAAEKKVRQMGKANDKFAFLVHLPHLLAVFLGVFGAVVSVPLVFHRPTAVWFNERFVTQDEPEWEKVDTFFEVGTWTWSWMEPVMGTLSFLLLGLQFARANMQNLEIKPYTALVRSLKAARLARIYPQYDPDIVKDFAQHEEWRPVLLDKRS
eukprot:EG_transcript_21120